VVAQTTSDVSSTVQTINTQEQILHFDLQNTPNRTVVSTVVPSTLHTCHVLPNEVQTYTVFTNPWLAICSGTSLLALELVSVARYGGINVDILLRDNVPSDYPHIPLRDLKVSDPTCK